MSEPLIRPAERRKLQEGLAACARCLDRVEAMRQAGIERSETAARAEAAQQLITGILALDTEATKGAK